MHCDTNKRLLELFIGLDLWVQVNICSYLAPMFVHAVYPIKGLNKITLTEGGRERNYIFDLTE